MIEVARQLKPASKRVEKHLRQREHEDSLKKIYERGADVMPANYLVVHQEAEPERKFKILAEAKQRRLIRAAKRRANWHK